MKYLFINDIQWISKEIHMHQNGIVFHVSMWWVTKKKCLWTYFIIYKSFYEKNKSSRYHCCSNVRNSEDSNAFSVKLFDIYIFFNRFEDLGKIIKNKDYLFSLGQSMKKLIMVKVGHFVWDKLWCRIML